MVRLLSAAVTAALALLTAQTTAARIHIHARATTPSPSPSVSATSASSSASPLGGQVVGSSVAISNATLTSCAETRWTFSQPDAPFVSVHFARFHILEGDVVTIATADGATSKRVTAPSGGATAFSSPRVPGPTAVVSFTPKGCLAANPLPREFKLEVDAFEYLYKTSYSTVGEAREICGAANQNKAAVCFKKAANVSSKVYTKARAVARLLKSAVGGLQSACTGFLLGSEGHLMTNQHCIKNAAEANATTFEFMVQSPTCSSATCAQLGECADQGKVASMGSDFVFASEKYDYAVVKLRCKPCLVNGKYGYLSLRRKEPAKGEPIYVVQHPNGGGKQITMQQDVDKDDEDDDEEAGGTTSSSKKGGVEQAVVAKVNDENAYGDFWTSYYADTEGGSSGSPVISLNDHAVLALHANGACKNSGAPSHLIIADLQKNKVALPSDAFA